MSIEIRQARIEEMDQFGLMGAYSYAGAFGDEPDNIVSSSNRPEWTLCAFDGPLLVTSFSTFPFTVRANGNAMAMGGITAVGTRPEYRRRGIMRKIMTQALATQREQGMSLAGLWASQAAIYQRYGFSANGMNRQYQVDTADIRFWGDNNTEHSVRRLESPEAVAPLKSIYREFIAQRSMYLHRSSFIWSAQLLTGDESSGPIHSVVVYANEQPVAYAVYSLRANKVKHRARSQEIEIRDLAWLTTDAYRSLWEYFAGHDLVGRVTWANAPIDDPAMDLFVEPRMLHCEDTEASWLRVVDVEQALSQRGYIGEGRVSLQLAEDNLTPWNNGTWLLEATASGATVSKASAPDKQTPSAVMDIRALSSLFSGMRTARQLRAVGLIEADDASVKMLEQLFVTHHAPHCPDHY